MSKSIESQLRTSIRRNKGSILPCPSIDAWLGRMNERTSERAHIHTYRRRRTNDLPVTTQPGFTAALASCLDAFILEVLDTPSFPPSLRAKSSGTRKAHQANRRIHTYIHIHIVEEGKSFGSHNYVSKRSPADSMSCAVPGLAMNELGLAYICTLLPTYLADHRNTYSGDSGPSVGECHSC